MVLGQYPAQGSTQLISKEWIAKARSRWDAYVLEYGEKPPEHSSATMGIEIGEFGSDANCACFRYGGYVEKPVSWGEVDTVITGDRAISEYKNRRVSVANVDATGVGAGVAPYMQRGDCTATPIKVACRHPVKAGRKPNRKKAFSFTYFELLEVLISYQYRNHL